MNRLDASPLGPDTMHANPQPDEPGALHLVALDPDHPGFRDQEYRLRRDAIARQALAYRGAGPVPDVDYTEAEQGVWREVRGRLDELHTRLAVSWVQADAGGLNLSKERVPTFADVNTALSTRTGFRLRPVAGLVEGTEFLRQLGGGTFLATQYLRHPSRPHYTPEPDALHELVGHAVMLAHQDYAELHRSFGLAAHRARTQADRQRLDRLYWRTMEFGLVEEAGQPRALGAGLLSSVGELERIDGEARLEPFEIEAVLEQGYDPTTYQPTLWVLPPRELLAATLMPILESLAPG